MAITDVLIRTAKAKARPYKISDEKGLYLLVNPGGSKLWRFKYRFAGKEKLLAIGPYPERTLRDARSRRDDARKLLADGIDPGVLRMQQKAMQAEAEINSFEAVAREWFAKFSPRWAKSHSDKIIRRLEQNVFPWLGQRRIGEIEPLDLLSVLRRIESRGLLETAHRVNQNCGQVFRYAVATGRAKRDPTADLRGALAPWRPQHYPSITESKVVGELLRAIHGYKGSPVTACALKLAPLVFVRPGELRRAEWTEFDLEAAEWRIPPRENEVPSAAYRSLVEAGSIDSERLGALDRRAQVCLPRPAFTERADERKYSECRLASPRVLQGAIHRTRFPQHGFHHPQ